MSSEGYPRKALTISNRYRLNLTANIFNMQRCCINLVLVVVIFFTGYRDGANMRPLS